MLVYIIPVVVFVVIAVVMYAISNDKEKNMPSNIVIRNILPAIVVSVLCFVFMSYREKIELNAEPIMTGNYFDI